MTNENLNEVVRKAMAGDKEAFSDLCNLKGQRIVYLCVQNMGTLPDGEDAAQEVFLRMQKDITRLKNPEAFSAWLYRAIQNACNNQRRRSVRKHQHLPIEEFADMLSEQRLEYLPQNFLEDDDKKKQLLHIVNALPHKMRMCIVLYYFEQLSRDEVADALGITPHSVSVTLTRARKQIRAGIEKLQPGTPMHQMLPMAALAGLLQEDANTRVPLAVVKSCIGAARAAPLAMAGPLLVAKAVVRSIAAVFVGGALTAGLLTGVLTLASTPSSHSPAAGVPQRPLSEAVPTASLGSGEGLAETAPLSGAATESMQPAQDLSAPAVAVPFSTAPSMRAGDAPTNAPQGPVSGAPAHSAVMQNPADAWVATPLHGRVELLSLNGKIVPGGGAYAMGFYVALLHGEVELARTVVDAEGFYQFSHARIAQSGSYHIRLEPLSPRGVLPAGGAGARTEVLLSPGMAETALPPLYVTDKEAPTVSVALYDDTGAHTLINPVLAEVAVADATATTCQWQVTRTGGTQPLLGGAGELPQTLFATLREQEGPGRYTLLLTVADAAGNETAFQQTFYVTVQTTAA